MLRLTTETQRFHEFTLKIKKIHKHYTHTETPNAPSVYLRQHVGTLFSMSQNTKIATFLIN